MSILKYKNASGQWEKVGIPNLYDVEQMVDEKISQIPTPDVSGQINSHNSDTSAHADIRQAIANINPVPFTISATAPSNTSIFWIDSANGNALKFYDGSAWVAVGAIWG